MKHNKARSKMIITYGIITFLTVLPILVITLMFIKSIGAEQDTLKEPTTVFVSPSPEVSPVPTIEELTPKTSTSCDSDSVDATQSELETEQPSDVETNLEYTGELLGEFTITYYCSCKKCCGKWAENRPIKDGKEIVYTASGAIAEAGVTIAVDPTKIPYGTTLYIEGVGYRVAQDCGGAIKGNKIDVYMDSHEAALEAGIHTATVYLIEYN